LDNATPNWLRQLDLDPRYRAVAAYGKRVVQQQQEALMASAWDQVGEVERANDILRHAQLVRRASQAIYTRHISQLPSGTLLEISRPVHTRVAMAANATVRKVLATNNMPSSVVTRAFTRIARPRGPLMRRMLAPAQRAAQPIATRVAGGLLFVAVAQPAFQLVTPEAVEQRYRAAGGARPAGPPPVNFIQMQVLQMSSIPPRPGFAVTAPQLPGTPLQVIFQLPPPSAADSAQAARFRAAVTAHQQMLGPVFMIFPLPPPTLDLEGTFRPALLSQMNPQSAVARWVRPLITVGGAPAANNDLEPVAAAPQFPQPMYEALRDLSQDVIAPALSGLPDNRVALLQTNPRFVEAFMAGLNHEMARELLWRGYPTDQRGTCFRVFWDRRGTPPTPGVQADGDIPPLHTWPPAKNLGEIASAASSSLVLLMRGEITRRYPNLVVYMVAAQWPAGQPRPRLGTQEVHPIFRGTLEPDIMFFGFPFSREQAVGTGAGSQPGWFFVIAEHPTAPRFGLDPAAPPGAIPPRADAALTGRALLQPPVRLAIHAGDLLRRT
jgi:hypothetical protein